MASRQAQVPEIGRMNTKQKGDIAEQAAILKFLELGYGVAKPIGDRLPYDLILTLKGSL